MNLIEKLGFDERVGNMNEKIREFTEVADESVRKELKLIQSAQLYNDVFAEEQIIASFRGLVNNLVNKSAAIKAAGYDACYQNAVSSLKSAIRNYDLDSYKRNKPSTYFTNYINKNLDKLHKSSTQGFAHVSDGLTGFRRNIYNAKSILTPQLGREPNNEEIYNFVKKDLGVNGANFTKAEIERLDRYNISEISGSKQINGVDGAEAMTFEEVQNSQKETPEDLINSSNKEQQVINSINIFTQDTNKRNFLKEYLGIGEFKNQNNGTKLTMSLLTQKHGISYHTAGKLLDGFKLHCQNRGVI